jgi:hypothetical protein
MLKQGYRMERNLGYKKFVEMNICGHYLEWAKQSHRIQKKNSGSEQTTGHTIKFLETFIYK